jgi:LmbE family N-acetylglucosaminyl deacetylase
VAVEGHPDDVELGCLGTLIKLRDEGSRVTIVSLTDGGNGTAHDPGGRESIAQVRAGEASSVATRLGGTFACLGARDGYLFDSPSLRDELAVLLRECEADLVLAPPPTDYHFDHVTAGQLAFSAVYHSHAALGVAGRRLARTPRLYYYDAIAGVEFAPSFYVDVTDQMAEKRELIQLHASQMANMQTIGGWDLLEYAEIVGRYRGLQAVTQYAEAFQSCLQWPRTRALTQFPV